MAARKKTVAADTKTAATKTTEKAAAVKAEAVKTETVKAEAAKTETVKAAEVKPAAKRACKKVTMELQYGDKCIDISTLENKAVAAWAEVTGNAKTAAKSINLYVKPEENTLYYVIEGDTGMVEL
ncbi:MAG: DUF6465 family protein [Ruminococcus sp.]